MKKPKFLTIMVILSIVNCMIYGGVAIYYQYTTGTELSPTLTQEWFKLFGTEIVGTIILYLGKKFFEIGKIRDKIGYITELGFKPEKEDVLKANSSGYDFDYDYDYEEVNG